MSVNRMSILVLTLILLGVLVWYDNQQDEPARSMRDGLSGSPPKTVSSIEQQNDNISAKELDQSVKKVAGAAAANPNPLATLERSLFHDTFKRPLFAPRRRRPPPKKIVKLLPPPKPVIPKPKLPSYELLGIIKNGHRAIAVLREADTQSTFRVEVGDVVGGWQVSSITPKHITLRGNDGDAQKVKLFENEE